MELKPPKILAIKLRAIGDTVIWTSALSALRKKYPDTEIHVLTYAANEPVLAHNHDVDQIHVLQSHSGFELWRKLWALRSEQYDWLLGFHASHTLCRWAWMTGARFMALHHHSWQYTPRGSMRIAEPGKLEDAIARDYQLLRAMNFEPAREPTKIVLTGAESEWAEREVRAKIEATRGDVAKPRMVFLPGASHHLRRYPKDLLLPMIAKVKEEGKYQPLIMCDSKLSLEWNLYEEAHPMGVPLFDRGSLREFICLVSRAQHAFANDSGPGHIAVALGLQTEFVFGPGCVGDWFPYEGGKHKVHRVEVPCRAQGPRDQERFQFCTVDQCEHHSCMRKLNLSV